MAKSLLEYAEWLAERKLRWPAAPKIESAKATAYLKPLTGIRAITWNVYGTLLRITDGELLFQHPQAIRMEIALDKTIQEFNMWNSMTRKPGKPWEYMQQKYLNAVDELKMASSGRKGDATEVNSAHVWKKLLSMLDKKDYQYDTGLYGDMDELSEKVAYFFHSSLQGVEAAPGALPALQAVQVAGLRQALLTDAQPFTVVQLFRALLEQGAIPSPDVFFTPSLNTFSYKESVRKPSKTLYLRAVDRFVKAGIQPEQILHVSSKVHDDLAIAKSLGMRTALYASEKLGLQAAPEDLKDSATKPDRLITELTQIRDLLGV
ncbi:MAG TPA: HAD hydrolase-like protein [Schlesneria sp.]|jgi:FMN phosphatase YigB (HAD superfamily)